MSKLRFTTDHEWLRQDDDGLLTVGITAYAQDALGDVVFVQLPELGEHAAGSEVAVLESVKAASNILMPLDGEVVEKNRFTVEVLPGAVKFAVPKAKTESQNTVATNEKEQEEAYASAT